MSRMDENIARVRSYKTHGELLTLWESIRSANGTVGWDAGLAFEFLVLRAFEIEGGSVEYPFSVKLFDELEVEQIDGMVEFSNEGFNFLVESKDQANKISLAPLAKLRNQLSRRPSNLFGCFFSRSGFTEGAVQLGHFFAPQTILLWDGDDVDFCLRNEYFLQGLKRKFKYAMKEGKPKLTLLGLD